MVDEYTDEQFWRKILRYARVAGKKVIELALQLHYAAQEPETPAWAKGIIYGTLAYFILPADAIPDAIPAVGYSDDLGALAAAVGMVAMYITPDIKQRAKEKVKDWFGKGEEECGAEYLSYDQAE